jgi:hypothetical protein
MPSAAQGPVVDDRDADRDLVGLRHGGQARQSEGRHDGRSGQKRPSSFIPPWIIYLSF